MKINYFFSRLFFLLMLVIPFKAMAEAEAVHEYEQEYFDFDNDLALADLEKEHAVHEPDPFQAKFLHMLLILALLIGFMVLASWMLKRMMKARITQVNQTSLIKVLETRHLSPKAALYLIEIEGEMHLIGESSTTLNHIASFPGKS